MHGDGLCEFKTKEGEYANSLMEGVLSCTSSTSDVIVSMLEEQIAEAFFYNSKFLKTVATSEHP